MNLFICFSKPPLDKPDHLLLFYCISQSNWFVCVHTHPVSLLTRQTWKPIKTPVTLRRRWGQKFKQYIHMFYIAYHIYVAEIISCTLDPDSPGIPRPPSDPARPCHRKIKEDMTIMCPYASWRLIQVKAKMNNLLCMWKIKRNIVLSCQISPFALVGLGYLSDPMVERYIII